MTDSKELEPTPRNSAYNGGETADAPGGTVELLEDLRGLRRENEELKKLVAEQAREIRWLRFVSKLDWRWCMDRPGAQMTRTAASER